MKYSFCLFLFIALLSCTSTDKKAISESDSLQNDTVRTNQRSYSEVYDSIVNAKVDTSTLEGKREKIMNEFLMNNSLHEPDYDTLIDLNYDNKDDYVIGYYGQWGTGIKNHITVCFFDSKKGYYVLNQQLTDLPNPTFYLPQKKITGFYIGNGGGSGSRLEWIKGKWVATQEFEVDGNGDSTVWIITYPLKNKTEKIVRSFQGIPPADILETNIEY